MLLLLLHCVGGAASWPSKCTSESLDSHSHQLQMTDYFTRPRPADSPILAA